MSHEIHSFAYNKQNGLPWHNLGTPVEGAMTVEEALTEGGANFVADKLPIFSETFGVNEDGEMVTVKIQDPDHFMVVRMDTMKALGVVGSRYEIVQMKQAFDFFDAALGESRAVIDTVGMLNGGKTGFMLARLPESVDIVRGDTLDRYLLFTNSFDGSSPVRCISTAIRVVCRNTLQAAMGSNKGHVKIRHTKSAKERIKMAHKVLNADEKYWQDLRQALEIFARKAVTVEEVDTFLETVFPAKDGGDIPTRTENRRQAVLEAFEASPGANMAGHTAWGLYNGLTWWLDHEKSVRETTDRWEASTLGSGANIRQRGFDALLALSGA